MSQLTLEVNGRAVAADVAPTTLLLDLLRETLHLTGTHSGCDTAQCGACTVLVDGGPVKSCSVLALQMQGRRVTTVEGLPALAPGAGGDQDPGAGREAAQGQANDATAALTHAQGTAAVAAGELAAGQTPAALHPLQTAFMDCHGLQCGFCTPGMLMAAAGLLAANPDPSDAEIVHALEGNLCRCTGYVNIVAAVKQAAGAMRASREGVAA